MNNANRYLNYAAMLPLTMTITACVTSSGPPPVTESRDATSTQQTAAQRHGDLQPPGETAMATAPVAATASLLAAAQQAILTAEYNDAISYLERAVRIEPRNASLWLALSDAHLANANTQAATQHARKAIALAGDNQNLVRLAWLKLADVREAEGNLSEARAIRRRYSHLSG